MKYEYDHEADTEVEKVKAIKFLRYIGDDYCDDESVELHIECNGQTDCPDHQNCGICRFEYMRKQGWLSPTLTLA